jgi:DNA end-binding protein Ku
MATTVHCAYEIRNAAEYFEDISSIKLPGEMVELAEHILETKARHFDASEFEDRYENRRRDAQARASRATASGAHQPSLLGPGGNEPPPGPLHFPLIWSMSRNCSRRRSVEAENPTAARGKAADRKKTPSIMAPKRLHDPMRTRGGLNPTETRRHGLE